MPITQEHELHRRRLGRNLGLGLVLGAFVALVFVLTMVKVEIMGPAAITGRPAPATAQP